MRVALTLVGTPQKSPKRFRISEAHNAVIAQGGGVKTVRKLFGVASDSASMRQFGLAVLRIKSAPRTTGPNCCLPPFAGGGAETTPRTRVLKTGAVTTKARDCRGLCGAGARGRPAPAPCAPGSQRPSHLRPFSPVTRALQLCRSL